MRKCWRSSPASRSTTRPDLTTSARRRRRRVEPSSSAPLPGFTARLPAATTLTSLTAFRKLDFDRPERRGHHRTESDRRTRPRESSTSGPRNSQLASERARVAWIAGMFLFDESDRQPVSVSPGNVASRESLRGRRLGTLGGGLRPGDRQHDAADVGDRRLALFTRTKGHREPRRRCSRPIVPEVPVAGTGYAFTDAISHAAWTPKFGVDLRARSNVFVYVSATRGFKSGGFNLTSRAAGRGYAPEFGVELRRRCEDRRRRRPRNDQRGRVPDGLLGPAGADVDPSRRHRHLQCCRGHDSRHRGGRDRAPRLTRTAQVGISRGSTPRTIDTLAVGLDGSPHDVSGHRLNNAQPWSGRVWLEWGVGIGRRGMLSLRADSRWQSTVFFTPFNDIVQRQPTYGLLGFSADFRPNQRRCVRGRVGQKPHERGLPHRHVRFTPAGNRRPARGVPPGRDADYGLAVEP